MRTYLSRLELEQIAKEGSSHTPSEERFHGALLFVDVSGFTPITEALAKQGPRGAESLSEILNDYYGRLTNLVGGYGGDVLFFAGDAAAALFRADSGMLGDAVSLATACGLEVRRALDGFAAASAPGFRLALRAMVGAGALRTLRVGTTTRLTLVTGAPIEQVARLGGLKAPRGIVVAAGAHRLLGDATAARHIAREAFDVTELNPSPDKPGPIATTSIPKLEDIERALPQVVVERTHAGQKEFLAEFRMVSVVFVGLPAGATSALTRLHATITALTELVTRFDGAVYQFLEDDKGTTLVVSFGIPPRAHEDDAARASLFAAAVFTELEEVGTSALIGVATGRLFCGAYGGAERKQYSLVGPTINRAARLMQAASEHGVLCDDATRRAAERDVEFVSLGSVVLKGLEEAVLVSRPVGDAPRSELRPSLHASVGRSEERAAMTEAVLSLRGGRAAAPVVLVAEAGMGKSHMMAELRDLANVHGVRVVRGDADSMDAGTPYFAFRNVFSELLGVKGLDVPAAQARVLDALSGARELLPIASLLTVVLPLDWTETPLTKQMTPQIRAENLARLLLHLLEHSAEQAPFLLVLEDAHWLDSASWALVTLLRREVPKVTIVVTMRPMDHEPSDCARLKDGAVRLALPPMNREQTIAILVNRFGVKAIPAELVDFVAARAEGNPFYIEEIAYSLRDSGRVRIANGSLEATAGWEALSSVSFPESLEAVITSRIDRLSADEQLTLKVASVVGRHFDEAALRDALPVAEVRSALSGVLERLRALELVLPEQQASWTFRHAVTRETTYGLLSYSQRRSLHRAVAEHLERRHEHDLSPVYARLAQHWSLAENTAKAASAYGNAGEQSLGAYANEEAITFLKRALELDPDPVESTRSLRHARWLKLAGDAHYSLASHHDARTAYESSLRAVGLVPPSGAAGAARQLARHFFRRVRQRLTGHTPRLAVGDARERALHVMQTNAELGAVFLWEGAQTKFLQSAFTNRNLADLVGPGGEAAAAMSGAAFVLAMMGLHGLAEHDLNHAVSLAEEDSAILPRIQTYVLQGMFLSSVGRAPEALAPLRKAGVLADELGGGLWKHRAKFMLGEPLIMLGAYDDAARAFDEAAVHSIGAEPTVVGFSHAMRALSRLRLGNVDEALSLLEGPQGIAMIRPTTVPLQLFASLGPLAEAKLASDDVEGALAAIREAEAAAPGEKANGYFAGIHGHFAACNVYLTVAERASRGMPSPLKEDEALAGARRAARRFAKFTRTFPGARASSYAIAGRLAAQSGNVRRGLTLLDKAASEAKEKSLPYEEASAHAHAARYLEAEGRRERLQRAAALFERFGMKLERQRLESSSW
ncbi:MAG TPA: AAA family ATPase [Polyangiaceae bacterium]|nr:AAA family ATPase [Polyangiaceae bacterium]